MGNSGRGGARAGGGRPSRWENKPTTTIRVPEVFAETLLEIAENLDQGIEDTLVIDRKSMNVHKQTKKEQLALSKLRVYKHSGHKVLRLEELISVLQSCID